MDYTAVRVAGVSKHFRIHTEGAKTVKERTLSIGRGSMRDFTALEDVSFDVKPGETLGLLGHNGSGKSTLLKCIAGTLRPSSGEVEVRGRLAAMLELGAGFHPDLTGTENVYLNGSILGFSRAHIDRIFGEIVEFSELGGFMDTQVKYYSSGMYARLGFAVAVNLEPDILLIDEVLAVGDEAFQRKCLEKVRGLQTENRTLILVTHAADQVRQICDRAIVLHEGRKMYDGEPDSAVAVYRRLLGERLVDVDAAEHEPAQPGTSPVSLTGVTAEPPDGRAAYRTGDTVEIRVSYRCDRSVPVMRARLLLHSFDGLRFLDASTLDISGSDLVDIREDGWVVFRIHDLVLTDGQYLASAVLCSPDETETFDRADQVATFSVDNGTTQVGRVRFDLSMETSTQVAVHE